MGERIAPPWWHTQFLTEVGLRAMRRIFPRTALASAIASVTEVARAEHDVRVGVGGRYHLFRFPTQIEEESANALRAPAFAAGLDEALKEPFDGLLAKLETLAVGTSRAAKEGPISFGDVHQIANPRLVAEIAAQYRASADSGARSYPYLEASSK
jgi:hypothetical protein